EFPPDRPAELSRAQAELAGKRLQTAVVVEGAGLDARRGQPRSSSQCIDRGVPRGQLGAAPQARAETRVLRRRGAGEEPAAVSARCACRANGPAVDSRRRHADEEEPVEAGIASSQGAVAGLGVDSHEGNVPAPVSCASPFSDIETGLAMASENGEWETKREGPRITQHSANVLPVLRKRGYTSAMPPDDSGPRVMSSAVQNPNDTELNALFDRYQERLRRTVRLRLNRRLSGIVDSSSVLGMVRQEAARRSLELVGTTVANPFLWLRQLTGDVLTRLHQERLGPDVRGDILRPRDGARAQGSRQGSDRARGFRDRAGRQGGERQHPPDQQEADRAHGAELRRRFRPHRHAPVYQLGRRGKDALDRRQRGASRAVASPGQQQGIGGQADEYQQVVLRATGLSHEAAGRDPRAGRRQQPAG